MRFNPKARLDTSRVQDAGRGSAGSGGLGGGIRIPGGLKGGGGIVGVIIAVVVYFIANSGGGGGLGSVLGGALGMPQLSAQSLNPARFAADEDGSNRYADCKTGEDANDSVDCARVAVENSLTTFWKSALGSQFHAEAGIVTFSGGIQTQGCGGATADVGPFYCPNDETIYLDTTFFSDVLQGQLDGPDGAFVEPYVLAHEYGHHISKLLGEMKRVKGDTGEQSTGVRLELQADCFAGVWTNNATKTPDADGNVLITDLSQDDIDNAMAAAKAVGDDYIQSRAGGRVDKDSWTHGSSAQRQKWFNTGYTTGDYRKCNTFDVPTV